MSYTEATALIRQAEREIAGGGTRSTATVLFPRLGILPNLPPQLPSPRP